MTATTADRSTANLAAVKDIYDAFGRGDIPAILGKIAPGCRWESWENNRAQRQEYRHCSRGPARTALRSSSPPSASSISTTSRCLTSSPANIRSLSRS